MKNKVCNICKTFIDTDKEYCEFKHMERKGKAKSTSYYHIKCFRERLGGTKEMKELQRDAKSIMQFAKQNLGIPDIVEV